MIKFLACMVMIIDHVAVLWQPECHIMRIIGRLAFPVFAVGVVSGLMHTHNLRSYSRRLLVVAVISQFASMFMHGDFFVPLNCVFGFGLAAYHLYAWRAPIGFKSIFGRVLLFGLCLVLPIDYGLLSSLGVLGVYLLRRFGPVYVFHAFNLVWAVSTGNVLQLASLVWLPLQKIQLPKCRWLPRSFFYAFYPAHMIALGVARLGLLAA